VPPSAWSDPATEELLGLAVDLMAAGDPRGGTLLSSVLERECGREFAQTVCGALAGGTPPAAFDFLPAQSGRLAAPLGTSEGQTPPPGAPPPAGDAAHAVAAAESAPDPEVKSAPRRAAAGLPASGYVSAADVAAHFGVSSKAVYRWMASGRIRAERRPGGSYRIPAEQFHSK